MIRVTADVLPRNFKFPPQAMEEAKRRIQAIARTVTPSVRLDIIKEEPTDNRVLECAVLNGADYVATGDKDLLQLERYDTIQIVSMRDFFVSASDWGAPGSSLF